METKPYFYIVPNPIGNLRWYAQRQRKYLPYTAKPAAIRITLPKCKHPLQFQYSGYSEYEQVVWVACRQCGNTLKTGAMTKKGLKWRKLMLDAQPFD